MNLIRILFLVLVTLSANTLADQPKIKAAQDHLHAALRHVIKSGDETPGKHLDSASTALQMAQTRLENARKNKGSHTHVALEKIQASLKQVELTRKNSSNRDKAIAEIKSAIAEVHEARRAGAN
ncbi:MAG: hypothetical protein ACO1TE_08505 [Prosthecobacter sp.]